MKPKYKALQKERADLLAEANRLLSADNPTAEDLAAADLITKTKLPAIDAQLATFEALFEAERTAPARSSITVRPLVEDDPKRGFAAVGEFGLAVKAACARGIDSIDERLRIGAAPSNVHQETGQNEGFMVPPAFRDQIMEAISDSDESLLNVVDAEPTSSNAVNIIRDESTPWGATGVQVYWRNEVGQLTASKLATGEELVKLGELYAYVLASGELLQDASRLTARFQKKVPLAITYAINEAIVNGSGTGGKPLGWFTSGAKVTVSKESGQAADTVVAANIAKMFSRLINPGQGVWYINQDVLPQLMTMTLGNNSVFMPPASGLVNAPGGFLLGRPVRFLENCQTVGDLGDIQFVNPKGYYATMKGSSPEYAESMHLFFDYNVDAFRWIFRIAGTPYLSAAISPAKGSSTRAHVVVLEAR